MEQKAADRSLSRSSRFRTGCGISLALFLSAATASAQPSPKAQAAAPPVESVVVTGASAAAVNNFVQLAATPTHITGKVARWDVPICPYALGMPLDVTGLVVKRVKDVALKAGARVSSDPDCKPNIVIAFSTVPQELLDSIRKDHVAWLGYQSNSEELKRLGTVTRPIQAWYSTATVDLKGLRQVDSSRSANNGRGLMISAPCALIGGQRVGSGEMCVAWFPNAITAEVNASRIADGLQSAFNHVTIIVNPRALQATVSTVADYIAVLALAQINSLDTCQALPSITSLLANGCTQTTDGITANDIGYLKAVYAADPNKLGSVQKNEIARRMEQAGQ
jgi:hypothetical protein